MKKRNTKTEIREYLNKWKTGVIASEAWQSLTTYSVP